ncbi:DUF937 domain-containing protein [Deinococcus wulumuqiensis]|uniref:DUF937 domain-containing protein n=1 Tax=Deinococcus wulumuqiensis TaxID=980427 RepID=A0AAV4K8D3_9DEIO|nr:DUF937 domain-containing protein [Deinococcus wulumuqiensis]QII21187.1 DUF937 domain-containing protein [Deinococcus wulumuqiensis R12]GGI83368.1 hypothetical protein GCM10010914_17050 [Deinococcus wulumuqiensis]GGP29659.1 hypothetical protein GCM10008021_13100 [Deinococcus wulumuqiensis]
MMDIFNMLGGMGQAQQQVSNQLGTDPRQTESALEAAVPLLLGAMTRNAAQPGGLDALAAAVNQHDDSAILGFQQGQMPDLNEGQKILGHVFGGRQQAAANALSQRAGINPQMAMQILMMVAPLILSYLSNRSRAQGGQMGGNMGGQMGLPGGMGGQMGGLGSILGGLLGGMLGGAQPQGQPYQQTQPYQQPQSSGGAMFPGFPGGQAQPQMGGQMGQAGDLLGTLNRTLDRDGDGNALDDLIGMFGGRR